MISYSRIVIAPIFMYMFLSGDNTFILISGLLFFIAAISDYFDGWYARKYKVVSASGVFLDPLADKVLTTLAFVALVMLDVVPWLPVIVILFRDIFTTVLRIYAEKVGKPVITSKSAKLKTVLQMVFISAVLALFMLKSSGLFAIIPEDYDVLIHSSTVYYAMLGLTLFTIWTAIEYIYQNRKILFN